MNRAEGVCSVVPGGKENEALGEFSFAAGRRAKIPRTHPNDYGTFTGSFLWADANDCDFLCIQDNEFAVRATGGVRFVSSLTGWDPGNGVLLPPGSGSWSSMSDESMKENMTVVEGEELLNKVSNIPILTWNYTSQAPDVRHIGPTAQDFHRAFGFGEDDKHISNVDADGVALAAVQALAKKTNELSAKVAEISELKARIDELQKLIERNSNSNNK
jgi:hypothetical protein